MQSVVTSQTLKCGFHTVGLLFLLKKFIVLKYKHTTCYCKYFEVRSSAASSTFALSWSRLPSSSRTCSSSPTKPEAVPTECEPPPPPFFFLSLRLSCSTCFM